MKYNSKEAECVIESFQQFIESDIVITDYCTEEFFHVFTIKEIDVKGKIYNHIRFKDSLVDDCQNVANGTFSRDIDSLIDACFYKI